MSTIMTVKKFKNWIKKEGIKQVEIAEYFGVSKYAVTKWKQRNTIPRYIVPHLEALASLDRQTLQRYLRRPSVSLFE